MSTRRINGASVKVIRELLGIKVGDLALRIGVTPSSISHLEAGARQLGAQKVRATADALGVPIEAITYPVEVTK